MSTKSINVSTQERREAIGNLAKINHVNLQCIISLKPLTKRNREHALAATRVPQEKCLAALLQQPDHLLSLACRNFDQSCTDFVPTGENIASRQQAPAIDYPFSERLNDRDSWIRVGDRLRLRQPT